MPVTCIDSRSLTCAVGQPLMSNDMLTPSICLPNSRVLQKLDLSWILPVPVGQPNWQGEIRHGDQEGTTQKDAGQHLSITGV
ncbi:hypothetical protein RRG08_014198 [Elysia crispata]|uniref:Uncharacterized protein n=1 Tax=Elysia crispata TaxID=231223 RepID=A0AAE1D931_9GAST|nr:hypothetical protein RRG08_014198 [Elysia crispata]